MDGAEANGSLDSCLPIPEVAASLQSPSKELIELLKNFIDKVMAHFQVEDGFSGRLTSEEFRQVVQQPNSSEKITRFLSIVAGKGKDAHDRLLYTFYGVHSPLLDLIEPDLARKVSDLVTRDILEIGGIAQRSGSVEDRLHGNLKESCKNNLTLLLIGRPGVGKSSLANSILGKKVCKEGYSLEAVTIVPQLHEETINGVGVRIWDTPGLRDIGLTYVSKSSDLQVDDQCLMEAKRLAKKITAEGPPNLLLLCVDASDATFDRDDRMILRDIQEAFGEEVWDNSVVALTKANMLRDPDYDDPDDERYLNETVEKKRSMYRDLLQKEVGMAREAAKDVCFIAVGSARDMVLADGKPWLPEFWVTCLEKASEEAATSLVQLNRHRLNFSLNDPKEEGEEDDDEDDESDVDDTQQTGYESAIKLNKNQAKRMMASLKKLVKIKSDTTTKATVVGLAVGGIAMAVVGPIGAAFGATAAAFFAIGFKLDRS
eukprot:m.311122 g.311122  ORF g.311122 m.311122 type:complete len:486 (+) comp60354_c0_seq1:109-1566(+)